MSAHELPTPRTDSMEPWDLKYRGDGDYDKVPADFARQLERELVMVEQAVKAGKSHMELLELFK